MAKRNMHNRSITVLNIYNKVLHTRHHKFILNEQIIGQPNSAILWITHREIK